MNGRVVVWFSCGAASAVAAKMASDIHGGPGSNLHVVYCDTLAEEHRDNIRFLRQVERWIKHPIEIIKSAKYASVEDVWEKRRYMAGPAGAPCTLEMKKIPRHDYQLPNDLHIFGLTADESDRIADYEANNKDLELEWPLRDYGITKEGCYQILRYEDIEIPAMYKLGFKNNNCIGCVKSTSPTYWNRVREHFPAVFEARALQSRRIGCKLVQIYQKKRIFLDELPVGYKGGKPEEDVDCGVICVKTEAVHDSRL